MKYLLQSINGKIENLEVWQAQQIIENAPKFYSLEYEIKDMEAIDVGACDRDGIIPVGSIQFCEKALGKPMYPVEVPPIMRTAYNLGREYKIVSTKNMHNRSFCFIKRVDKLKSKMMMCAITDRVVEDLDGDCYQVSEYIDLAAEYRVISIKGEIVYMGWYNGDIGVFPDMDKVKMMVMQYANLEGGAEAFTIDVGVDKKNNNTILIEIHPFVCCGTYGYSGFAGTEYLEALKLGWRYYRSEYNKMIEVDEEWEKEGSKYQVTTVKNETIKQESKLDWQFESIRNMAMALGIEYESSPNKTSKVEILEEYKKNRTT